MIPPAQHVPKPAEPVTTQPEICNQASAIDAHAVVQAGMIQHVSLAGSASSGVVPRPQQLPPDVSFFTGRAEELAKLDALLSESISDMGGPSVVISAIAGAGGMGKTALAVHWAHRMRDRFPDGQLYVNLRGYDPSPPLSPRQALDGFLRALGMSGETIPQEVDAMTASYRSLLANRCMLVVLDNAATPDQVRPLLPNTATCLVLVTSRSRLSGLVARDGAHRITLDQLSPSESVSLLREIIGPPRVGADPDSARDLARRCAFLPLALRIAAERIADRPHLHIADLAADLAREQKRLDVLSTDDEATAVRSVFSWSYRSLPADTARVFRLLGLHPGPTIGLPAAAALTTTSVDSVRDHVDMLISVHLLTEIGRDHYQFHDLIRDYALEQATTHESENHTATIQRVLAWYLGTAHRTQKLLNPNGREVRPISQDQAVRALSKDITPLKFTSRDQILRWYDTEHHNLFAAIQVAADRGLHHFAARMPQPLGTYLVLRARWADDIAMTRIGYSSAQLLDDPDLELYATLELGDAYMRGGRPDDADACLQAALEKARSTGNKLREAGALHTLALLRYEAGQLDAAATYCQAALSLYQGINQVRGEALMLGLLGDIHRQERRFDEALDHLHRSLILLRATSNHWNEALCLRQFGQLRLDQAQHDQAIDHFQRSASLYRELDDRYEAARTLHILGDTLHSAGHLDHAHHAWKDALVLYDELNAPEAPNLRARITP